jgi:hypothetical protein
MKDKITDIREEYTPEKLCEGLPNCFLKYWLYIRDLEFESKPDYALLKSFF